MIQAASAAAAALLLALAAAAAPPPDLERGRKAFQKCYACHALEPGRNDLSGPSLDRVLGRRIASEPGFAYSRSLRGFARRNRRWNERLIDRYLADPEALVPGTDMIFTGMRDPRERRDLIAYLRREAKTTR